MSIFFLLIGLILIVLILAIFNYSEEADLIKYIVYDLAAIFVVAAIFLGLRYRMHHYEGEKYLRQENFGMKNIVLLKECVEVPFELDPCENKAILNIKTGEKLSITD